jgi:phage antirepressor YoqD-like protein
MAQALRLAAEQAEQIEAQQEQLALAAPKVALWIAMSQPPAAKGIPRGLQAAGCQ